MTPMQEFALTILKEREAEGVSGAHVGNRWKESKGERVKSASRDSFGSTSAGYRALRALVSLGLAKVKRYKTSGGYTIETYYPA